MKNKPNILIVDDEEINRLLLKDILEDEYNIYFASNGEEALVFLDNKKTIISLIILDINMPVMDGFVVLHQLKSRDYFKDIPVVIISSDSDVTTITKAYSLGASDYFEKPFVVEIVKKCVANTLDAFAKRYTDQVVGGYNRLGFTMEIETFLKNINNKNDYSMIFFNINNFKAFNQVFGTNGGTDLLKTFYSNLAKSSLEPVLVSRLELDHFAALVKTDKIDFDELTKLLIIEWNYDSKSVNVYGQAGVYNLLDEETSVDDILERARMALKRIDDNYVKPYAVFDEKLSNELYNQASVISGFDNAIKNKEFLVYYQPVIEAKTGHLASAEALVRWINNEKGIVSPGIFIPTLEKNGYISELDNFMVKTVYADMEERFNKNLPIIPVSVNLSWMDFYDIRIQDTIRRFVDLNNEMTFKIRYEVTETSYAALNNNNSLGFLQYLKSNSIKILLDDFGAGYSSYSILDRHNFDVLKIDMSLTKKITSSKNMQAIIISIINMCHEIGIKVLAEGVETEIEFEFLKSHDCDYIQGYYFSRPLEKDKFEQFIEDYAKRGMIA